MYSNGYDRGRSRVPVRAWHWVVMALVAAAFAAAASAAHAAGAVDVRIVRQGEPPAGKLPPKVYYYKTIQAPVNATLRADWVLIEPGVYTEEVKVLKPHSGIWIRGMDRNAVIIDGQHKPLPGGSN